MKFNIITFGCKVNAYESEYIKEQFLKNDFIYEDDTKNSDIVIVNTCSVTNTADNKCLKTIRGIKRDNKDCILVVCGCSAENHRHEFDDLGIDILIGNNNKSKLVTYVKDFIDNKETYCEFYDGRQSNFENMQVAKFNDLTRAFVKIQDGCNNFCSYCIIPYVRGGVRSKEINTAYKEIKELVEAGHREIVFTGINTGAYGKETGQYDLVDLIQKISKLEKLERIRVSSIEITEIDDRFIEELAKNKKVCGHLHVSLQTGCDKVLKLMNRKYKKYEYFQKVQKIKKVRPDINLTTDVIVGFPGEDEEDFLETVAFCQEVGFSKIHVFPYSERKGTVAYTMPNKVPGNIRKDRARRLIKIDEGLQKKFNEQFVGKAVEVLIEEVFNDYSIGHTENFLKVIIKERLEKNKIYNVLIEEALVDCVNGKYLK